jgi:hypothetical protein
MKVFAREIIWFFIALVLATPVGFIFSYSIRLQPQGNELNELETVFEMEFFIIGAILGFMFTYFMRAIIWAVAKYLVPKPI